MKNIRSIKILFPVCLCVLVGMVGCGKMESEGEKLANERRVDECGANDECGSPEVFNNDEILKIECEHNVLAYQCDECRYEVGVVKLEEGLLKGGDDPSRGIVTIEKVSRLEIPSYIDVTGEVHLNENNAAHINPRIDGIVDSVDVDLGSIVSKGDILFNVNSVEFGSALAEYMKYKSLLPLSRKNLEREKKLHASEITSERELIAAQMSFEEHQTSFKAVEHKLDVLGVKPHEIGSMACGGAQGHATLLPVRSPINGTIIQKHVVVGEHVAPGADVMLVADMKTVWVWADIYESDLARLMANKQARGSLPVEVFVQAFPGKAFSGQIDYIGDMMDEGTRTVKVRATMDNAEGFLRPGMFCKVMISMSAAREVLVVPALALLSDEGQEFVFTHLEGDLYVRRPVKTGRRVKGFIEVVSGLSEGDPVVREGSFLLKSDVLREKMGAGCAD